MISFKRTKGKKVRLAASCKHHLPSTITTTTTPFSKTTSKCSHPSYENADQTKKIKRCCQVRIVLKPKQKRYKYKTVENRYLEVNKATALSKPN